jgi:hypothetical protein
VIIVRVEDSLIACVHEIGLDVDDLVVPATGV